MAENKLVDWVMEHAEEWRQHRDTNYLENWKKYERLWRGEWAAQDRLRDSERSRVTSPALQQAIENHTAEIEEAVFGQGDHLFDIDDDMADANKEDIEYLKAYMKECFKKNKIRKHIGDSVLLASIYGTGIAEIITKKVSEIVPATKPMEGGLVAVGTETKEKIIVYPKPVSPQNFLIDPNATCIEDALGCGIEEFVSAHLVAQKVKEGVYKDTKVEDDSTPDEKLEASWLDQEYNDDKIRILRYYGLVPRTLLESEGEEVEELFPEDDNVSELMEEYGDMVEAIVVIANGQWLLKAEKNPFMMQDRPVIYYQDDTVPNRFWGRGVAEKGYNMQVAIDAELRSHLDSLALTTAPMMGIDATRLPRGSKFEVRPGKSILTNGNPAEILMPFKFGVTDGSNLETASQFERMLLQATGTMDTAAEQLVGGNISITLSGILKKNKRTLVNFQEQFLIPFIEKAAWRFMQFDPENFPVKDWKFVPTGSLGMLAREVEQTEMINLMKTLGPDSPILPIIMRGVLETSNLANKQQMIKMLEQSMQPSPEQQQQQQMEMEIKVKSFEASLAKILSEIEVNKSVATKNIVDAQTKPEEVRAKVLSAVSTNLPNEDDKIAAEFDRRVKVAELMLKEADLDQNAKIVQMQMNQKVDKVSE